MSSLYISRYIHIYVHILYIHIDQEGESVFLFYLLRRETSLNSSLDCSLAPVTSLTFISSVQQSAGFLPQGTTWMYLCSLTYNLKHSVPWGPISYTEELF